MSGSGAPEVERERLGQEVPAFSIQMRPGFRWRDAAMLNVVRRLPVGSSLVWNRRQLARPAPPLRLIADFRRLFRHRGAALPRPQERQRNARHVLAPVADR